IGARGDNCLHQLHVGAGENAITRDVGDKDVLERAGRIERERLFDRGAAAGGPAADDDLELAIVALLHIEGATYALDAERFDPSVHVLRTLYGGGADNH